MTPGDTGPETGSCRADPELAIRALGTEGPSFDLENKHMAQGMYCLNTVGIYNLLLNSSGGRNSKSNEDFNAREAQSNK